MLIRIKACSRALIKCPDLQQTFVALLGLKSQNIIHTFLYVLYVIFFKTCSHSQLPIFNLGFSNGLARFRYVLKNLTF